jgi:hypothetical protein|tara:strand:+ start:5015 stop:5971 length:957 start_codon:yes stop_codon:yes gene_type:complete
MRGGRGDAQRRAQHSAATTSQPGRFADYVKFDDMFGASCIFTSGDPVQVRREREAYVKDTMERKLYGYVHTLETHGAPITRVVVGGGCESVENRGGFPETRPRSAMAVRDPAAGGDDPFGRKRARVAGAGYGARPSPRAAAPVWNQPSFEGTGGRVPATTTHDGGSLANLFEQSLGEDWEQDPLWAAMDSMGTPGGAGGTSFKNGALAVGGGLDDQQGLVQSGVLRPTATAEDDFERRARIELIEVSTVRGRYRENPRARATTRQTTPLRSRTNRKLVGGSERICNSKKWRPRDSNPSCIFFCAFFAVFLSLASLASG